MLNQAGLSGVEIEVVNKNQPNYTGPKERIVQLMTQNVNAIVKDRALLAVAIGASDQWRFRAKGVPSARYGPAPHSMGGNDEYIYIKELLNVARVHSATAIDYLTDTNDGTREADN